MEEKECPHDQMDCPFYEHDACVADYCCYEDVLKMKG